MQIDYSTNQSARYMINHRSPTLKTACTAGSTWVSSNYFFKIYFELSVHSWAISRALSDWSVRVTWCRSVRRIVKIAFTAWRETIKIKISWGTEQPSLRPSSRSLHLYLHAVEAPVSGHPREVEKVSATWAGRLRECVNYTEFVWTRVQTVFCQGGRK